MKKVNTFMIRVIWITGYGFLPNALFEKKKTEMSEVYMT